MKSVITALGLVLVLATSPALALTVTDCRPHDAAQETADSGLIDKAVPLMQSRDLAALATLRPDIEAALLHAPDTASLPEVCGNTVVVYSGDTEAFMALRAEIGSDPRFAGAAVQLRPGMPYATLSYISGWIAYEQGDIDAAIADYRKGLSNDPASTDLASEYSNALLRQGRMADVVTFVDGFLAARPNLDPAVVARLERRRDVARNELASAAPAAAPAPAEVSMNTDPALVEINRKIALRN